MEKEASSQPAKQCTYSTIMELVWNGLKVERSGRRESRYVE
jgi:hypothetical protein